MAGERRNALLDVERSEVSTKLSSSDESLLDIRFDGHASVFGERTELRELTAHRS
jgi:hypothetical protein